MAKDTSVTLLGESQASRAPAVLPVDVLGAVESREVERAAAEPEDEQGLNVRNLYRGWSVS